MRTEFISTTFTYMNTMLGSALLTLPYANARLGWIQCTALIIAGAVFCTFALRQVIKGSYYSNAQTLLNLFQQMWPKLPKLAITLDVSTAIEYSGYLICYVSIAGDYIRIGINSMFGKLINIKLIKLVLLPIILILSIFGTPKSLAFVSSLAIVCVFVTVICTFVFYIIAVIQGNTDYFDGNEVKNMELQPFEDLILPANSGIHGFLEFLQRFTLIMPLFSTYCCTPMLIHSMHLPGPAKVKVVLKSANVSITLVCIICIFMATVGYLLFGRNVNENILVSFSPQNYTMTVCRLLYAIVILLSYVVILFPPRRIILYYLHLEKETSKKGAVAYYVIGIAIVCISVVLSIFIPSITLILSCVSSILGIGIRYLIPLYVMYYRKFVRGRSPNLFSEHVQLTEAEKQLPEDERNKQIEKQRKSSVLVNYMRKSITQALVSPNEQDAKDALQKQDKQQKQNDVEDVIQEQDQQPEQQQTKLQQLPDTVPDEQELVVANEDQEQEDKKDDDKKQSEQKQEKDDEDVYYEGDYKFYKGETEEQKEYRKQLQQKPSLCHAITIHTIAVIFVIMNLSSFVINTFFDQAKI